MANEQREPSIPLPGGDRDRGAKASTAEREREREGVARTSREPVREPARPARPRAGLGSIIAALVVGLILGALALKAFDSLSGGDPFAGKIDDKRFQAVILSNDKVYFGRISDASDTFFELDDAFFLRETQDSEDAEPVRALLPVNRELHAPENRMLIRKDEVVLVENLASDSPVLKEIKRQKQG